MKRLANIDKLEEFAREATEKHIQYQASIKPASIQRAIEASVYVTATQSYAALDDIVEIKSIKTEDDVFSFEYKIENNEAGADKSTIEAEEISHLLQILLEKGIFLTRHDESFEKANLEPKKRIFYSVIS